MKLPVNIARVAALRGRLLGASCLLLGLFYAPLGLADNAAESGPEPESKPATVAKERTPLPSLDELLERESVDPDTYTERCLTTRRIRSHQVLDSQHLVFEMRGGEHFLVQFPRRCFGLRRGDPISYSTSSGQLCKLDDIRPLERRGRGLEPGIPCYIPNFQRVTEEQLDYLATALKERRNRR